MSLLEQFNSLYLFLNTSQNSFSVFIGFVVILLAAIVMRVIVCVGYKAQLTLFRLNAKEVKSKTDIKDSHSAFTNRIVRDYIKTGEKGVAPRSAKDVVDKHINRLAFLGFGYDGLSAFAISIENGIILIGLVLAVVFEDYRYAFAVTAVAGFVVMRAFAAIFDFASSRERLSLEVSEYVEREIGQFYANDSGSLILRLKNDLSAAVLRQSEALSDSVKKMGEDVSNVMLIGLKEMSKSVDSTMMRVSDFGGEFSEPLEKWKKAINEAAAAQEKFSKGIVSFEGTSKTLSETAKKLHSGLNAHADVMRAQSGLVREEIEKLVQISAGLRDASEPLFTQGDGISKQLSYIERNQETLEHSIQRFELIMEDMTRKLGDGLGSMIDYQVQSSYTALNKALADNIKQIVSANNELVERMSELFVRLQEQSRSEAQTVLKIKEQMDLHFENLNQG